MAVGGEISTSAYKNEPRKINLKEGNLEYVFFPFSAVKKFGILGMFVPIFMETRALEALVLEFWKHPSVYTVTGTLSHLLCFPSRVPYPCTI